MLPLNVLTFIISGSNVSLPPFQYPLLSLFSSDQLGCEFYSSIFQFFINYPPLFFSFALCSAEFDQIVSVFFFLLLGFTRFLGGMRIASKSCAYCLGFAEFVSSSRALRYVGTLKRLSRACWPSPVFQLLLIELELVFPLVFLPLCVEVFCLSWFDSVDDRSVVSSLHVSPFNVAPFR